MTSASGFRAECLDRGGWRVLVAAAVGVAFGLTTLPFYTLGVFTKPLAEEFGWSRAEVQGGLTSMMVGTVASAWAIGWAIDRFGVRRVALLSQLGLAIGLVVIGSAGDSVSSWYAAWFLMAVLAIGTSPITWTRGVAKVFDRGRGLALGLSLMSTGFMGFLLPPLLTWVVVATGWRWAYFAMAASVVVFALPLVYWLFRIPGMDGARTARHRIPAAVTAAGHTFPQALRDRRFWILMVSFLLIAGSVTALLINLIPVLTDQGLSPVRAAQFASLVGVSIVLGRLLIGFLLDYFWAPAVCLLVVTLPALAALLLSQPPLANPMIALSAALIGFAAGAEFDLIAYLCSRYFGMRSYGSIYAWQWATFSLAAGIGPVIFGRVFDALGTYTPALFAAAVALVIGGTLLLTMGRYPRALTPGAAPR